MFGEDYPTSFEPKEFTCDLNNGVTLSYESDGKIGTLVESKIFTKDETPISGEIIFWLLNAGMWDGYVRTYNRGRTPAQMANWVAVMFAIAQVLPNYEPKFSIKFPDAGPSDGSVKY